jgi:hypothetical protein
LRLAMARSSSGRIRRRSSGAANPRTRGAGSPSAAVGGTVTTRQHPTVQAVLALPLPSQCPRQRCGPWTGWDRLRAGSSRLADASAPGRLCCCRSSGRPGRERPSRLG